MKKSVLLTLALCLVTGMSFGQKKLLNEIKKDLKEANPNIAEARKSIQQVLNDPETKDLAEAWYVAGQIEEKQFSMEKGKEIVGKHNEINEQIMNTALDAEYPYYLKAYELDNQPDEKGKVKPKFTKNIRSILKFNRASFANAGSYFYNEGNYQKSYDNFMLFLDMPELPMMKGEKFESFGDTVMLQFRYYAAQAAQNIPNHEAAIAVFESLKGKGFEEVSVYQYIAEEYKRMEDSVRYKIALEDGLNKFPADSYFILGLTDLALVAEDTNAAIGYLNQALSYTDDDFLYSVLGQLYRQNGEYEKAFTNINKAIELNPTKADYYAQVGNTYYVIAEATREQYGEAEKVDKKKAEELYEQCLKEYKEAIPSYEKALELDSRNGDAVRNLRFIYYITSSPEYDRLDKLYNEL